MPTDAAWAHTILHLSFPWRLRLPIHIPHPNIHPSALLILSIHSSCMHKSTDPMLFVEFLCEYAFFGIILMASLVRRKMTQCWCLFVSFFIILGGTEVRNLQYSTHYTVAVIDKQVEVQYSYHVSGHNN